MNFIFDIGNVLIDFKPEQFLRRVINDPSAENIINKTIYKSQEWIMLDMGTITPQKACDIFCERQPEYKEQITKVMDRLPDMLTPINETIKLLPKIKEQGHRLYYLSNYHKDLSRFILGRYPFFSLFDGGVFSCDVQMVKPNEDIYRYFLDKYKLRPSECVFFDDTKENADAAGKLGIKGVHFENSESISAYIALL